jgi:hypothetical protein
MEEVLGMNGSFTIRCGWTAVFSRIRRSARRVREMPAGVMSIVSAIRDHRLLGFRYDGRPRVVEPHIYGVNTKGHPVLSAYQLRGGSASGERVGWKMFLVQDMDDVRLLDDTFRRPREDYNPGDSAFAHVFAQL